MATFAEQLERLTMPLRRRLGAKVFAAACAFVLWFFVNAGERETQVLPFPIELRNVPERAVLTNPDRVDTVSVRLNGPGPLMASLDARRSPIVVDLSKAEVGQDLRLKIRDEMVRVPRGVRILEIEPSRIPVRLERVKRMSVPVNLAATGEPRDGFKVERLQATPAKVQVSGPASIIDRLTVLDTEPIDLTDLSASTQKTVGLVRTDQLGVKPEVVTVDVTVAPIMTTRDFKRLNVEVRNVDRPFQLKPARVNLTVRGPQRVVQDLTLDDGAVYVDGGNREPGEHMVEAEVTLPPEVEVVKRDPPVIRLEILEPKPEPKPEAKIEPKIEPTKNGARR
jgi:YbbR domain-containing protein